MCAAYLGGGIDGEKGTRAIARPRRDRHDGSILTGPHHREDCRGHVEGAMDVAVDHGLHLRRRELRDVLGDLIRTADIIDEQTDTAIGVHDLQAARQLLVEPTASFSGDREVIGQIFDLHAVLRRQHFHLLD